MIFVFWSDAFITCLGKNGWISLEYDDKPWQRMADGYKGHNNNIKDIFDKIQLIFRILMEDVVIIHPNSHP